MSYRNLTSCLVVGIMLASIPHQPSANACCAVYPSGTPVVNSDQTVIILWDAATKTQHLIRQASFKSAAGNFGFLVPTPSRPELEESGNDAFPYLRNLTEPEVVVKPRPWSIGIGCAAMPPSGATPAAAPPVTVLEEKMVAGFHAVVLKADSPDALLAWLNEHHYAFSPEVKAWAAPYVEKGWNITALQVAKDGNPSGKKGSTVPGETSASDNTIAAAALRMSFKTDEPLFPYREPDSTAAAESLGAKHRLLRIYFLSDARYQGSLGEQNSWSGEVAWAGPLTQADRSRMLGLLKLPESTGPAKWWLTEFENHWAYQPAPADLTFTIDASQQKTKRPPIIQYTANGWQAPRDVTLYAMFAIVTIPPLLMRWRQRNGARRR